MRHSPRILSLLFLAAAGGAAAAVAQEPSPSPSGVPQDVGDGTQTRWAQPEFIPPTAPTGPVKARLVPPPTPRTQTSPYLGMRALSTKEGEARLQTGDGPRTLRPGDRLGADVVKAVDEGLLVLFRPAAPGRPGGDATVVMRFDAAGQPSVRIYHTEDPTRAEPRQVH